MAASPSYRPVCGDGLDNVDGSIDSDDTDCVAVTPAEVTACLNDDRCCAPGCAFAANDCQEIHAEGWQRAPTTIESLLSVPANIQGCSSSSAPSLLLLSVLLYYSGLPGFKRRRLPASKKRLEMLLRLSL
ncbi:MAG: hypothetical protein R3C68_12660 [Myxococcota bacterium]